MKLSGVKERVLDFHLGMEREQMFYVVVDYAVRHRKKLFGIRFYAINIVICQNQFLGVKTIHSSITGLSQHYSLLSPQT